MSEWKRIDSIADVRRGASPRPIGDPKYFGGEVGWVRISDVTRSSRFLRETEQYLSPIGEALSVRVNPGDLVMSICGTLGRPIMIDMPACIHDGFVQFTNLRNADTTFLFYALQHAEAAFSGMGQPGTQTNLNTSLVGRHTIFCPSLSEQRRIAEILSTLDEAIEQTEALIAKMQQVKAGLMHDLFTRGVTPDGRLRPTREQAPELYKESPIGWIPREWEVKPLRQVAAYQHGRPFPSTDYSEEGVLLLRPGNLHASGIVKWDATHTTRIPYRWLQECPEYVLKADDIVMNLTAQSLEDQFLGRVCIVQAAEQSLLNQRIARFQALQTNHQFLYWLLRSSQFRNQINRTTQGTKVQHIYNSDLNSVVFAIPALRQEQEVIAAALSSISEMLTNNEADLEKLRKQKHGLMHDILTGCVRVKEAC